MRSPRMPKNGEKSEPSQASEAKTTSCCTEPVVESTYQPRISASISKAHDVARSAGHWKRKLRVRKGANALMRPMIDKSRGRLYLDRMASRASLLRALRFCALLFCAL